MDAVRGVDAWHEYAVDGDDLVHARRAVALLGCVVQRQIDINRYRRIDQVEVARLIVVAR